MTHKYGKKYTQTSLKGKPPMKTRIKILGLLATSVILGISVDIVAMDVVALEASAPSNDSLCPLSLLPLPIASSTDAAEEMGPLCLAVHAGDVARLKALLDGKGPEVDPKTLAKALRLAADEDRLAMVG